MAPARLLPDLDPEGWFEGRPGLLSCRPFTSAIEPPGKELGWGNRGWAACAPVALSATGSPGAHLLPPGPTVGRRPSGPTFGQRREGGGHPLLLHSSFQPHVGLCLLLLVYLFPSSSEGAVFNHVLVSSSLSPQWIPLEKAFERKQLYTSLPLKLCWHLFQRSKPYNMGFESFQTQTGWR